MGRCWIHIIRNTVAEALQWEDDGLELQFSISRRDRMHVEPSLLWSIRRCLRRTGSVLHVQDGCNVKHILLELRVHKNQRYACAVIRCECKRLAKTL